MSREKPRFSALGRSSSSPAHERIIMHPKTSRWGVIRLMPQHPCVCHSPQCHRRLPCPSSAPATQRRASITANKPSSATSRLLASPARNSTSSSASVPPLQCCSQPPPCLAPPPPPVCLLCLPVPASPCSAALICYSACPPARLPCSALIHLPCSQLVHC